MRKLITLLLALMFGLSSAAEARPSRGTILIYSGTTGYRHESIPAGIQAVTKLATQRGLQIETSEDPTVFSADNLKRFRAIVLLSCTTDPKNPASEWLVGPRRDALQGFLRHGGGVLAIHAAADSHYNWPWYGKMIGGHFARHPVGTPQGDIHILTGNGALTAGLGAKRSRNDEWYYFDDYDPTSRLLMTVDPASIGQSDVNPNPVSWAREVDGGRVFYTALGHTKESYADPWFLRLLANGLDWSLGRR